MRAIKDLLDLTNQYFQDLEINHPRIGLDFLAHLVNGASRAMRGQRVYTKRISQKTIEEITSLHGPKQP